MFFFACCSQAGAGIITLCGALGPRLRVVFIFLRDSRENETREHALQSPSARKVLGSRAVKFRK